MGGERTGDSFFEMLMLIDNVTVITIKVKKWITLLPIFSYLHLIDFIYSLVILEAFLCHLFFWWTIITNRFISPC